MIGVVGRVDDRRQPRSSVLSLTSRRDSVTRQTTPTTSPWRRDAAYNAHESSA